MSVKVSAGTCFHCGNSLPDAPVLYADHTFCCSGCNAAYRIITESGNGNYYELRESFAPTVRDSVEDGLYEVWERKVPVQNGEAQGLFVVEGLHCASCVWINEKVLKSVPGVTAAAVQLSTGRARISWNTERTNLREIARAVARLGYRLVPVENAPESGQSKVSRSLLKKMSVAGFFAGNIMLLSVSLYAGYFTFIDRYTKNFLQLTAFLMTLPVVFYSASVFFKNAYHALRTRTLSMDVLTATGISLAFSYSTYVFLTEQGEVFFDSICFVVFIILTGRYIESRLRLKSLYYVDNLRKRTPRTALVENDGQFTTTLMEDIAPGMRVRVEAGGIIPADGLLRVAAAEVEESMLTGEARPVFKRERDVLLAGVKAITALEMEVTSLPGESALSRIGEMVEQSLEITPAVVRFTDRASRWFIAFALLAAVFTFAFWQFYRGDLNAAILNTITLLIAACPCALSLAVPTVLTVSVQRAFGGGCLLKGSAAMEYLSKVRNLAFDKTGTLTRGEPEIVQIEIHDSLYSRAYLVGLSALLQKRADVHHPIARAFLRYESERIAEEPVLPEIDTVEYVPGQGVRAWSGDTEFYLGNRALLSRAQLGVPIVQDADSIAVYLARRGRGGAQLMGVFLLRDVLRAEASDVFERLRSYHLTLITGDTSRNGHSAAQELGIEEVFAEQSPEQKLERIRALKQTGATVMIGDGINDSIALAAADVGISFANASEISLHSADVLLLKNDLRQLLYLLRLARATRRIIAQNLLISFAYNVLLIPMACAGWIIPLTGALFMSISSLTVVLNALRLARFRG